MSTSEPPLVIVADRKADHGELTETEKTQGIKEGYFCEKCKSEIVVAPYSQKRIASRPDGNLICTRCLRRSPVLQWHLLQELSR